MSACPNGHQSETADYCDVCGAPIGGPVTSAPAAAPDGPAASGPAASPLKATPDSPGSPGGRGPADTAQFCAVPAAAVAGTCDSCGAPRSGRFCEDCGHDSALPTPAPPIGSAGAESPAAPTDGHQAPLPAADGWTAVATADRDWFEEVRGRRGPDSEGVEFPEYCPERRFTLTGQQLTIGRHSRSRGIAPDIDLAGPPLDPGVSAQHALLVADQAGGWRIVDLDSTNGTVLSGPAGEQSLRPHTPVTLTEQDTVKLGAWTTLRLRRR